VYLEYTVREGENPVCRLDTNAYGVLFRVAYFGSGAQNGR
jgi:hypothetical protein